MKIARLLVCCALAVSMPALAQKACSKADEANAEKAIDRVVNWQGLHKAYQDYGHCSSEAVNETFTDALLRLMLQWKDVDTLAGSVDRDAGYKKWMHARLLSPAAKDDRDSVYARAKKDCPGKHAAFCSELADVVKSTGGGSGKASSSAPSDALNFDTIKPLGSSAPQEKKK